MFRVSDVHDLLSPSYCPTTLFCFGGILSSVATQGYFTLPSVASPCQIIFILFQAGQVMKFLFIIFLKKFGRVHPPTVEIFIASKKHVLRAS